MKGLVGSPILVGGLGPGPPLNPALLYTQAHTLTKWSTQLLTPRLYHDSDKATKHVQLTGIWGRFLEYLFFFKPDSNLQLWKVSSPEDNPLDYLKAHIICPKNSRPPD